VQPTFEFIVVR